MLNKSVNAFITKGQTVAKYGKWIYNPVLSKLFFGDRLVAEYDGGEIVTYPRKLSECGFESQTYNAIEKVINHLNKN